MSLICFKVKKNWQKLMDTIFINRILSHICTLSCVCVCASWVSLNSWRLHGKVHAVFLATFSNWKLFRTWKRCTLSRVRMECFSSPSPPEVLKRNRKKSWLLPHFRSHLLFSSQCRLHVFLLMFGLAFILELKEKDWPKMKSSFHC